MSEQIIWWATIVFEVLLVVRAASESLASKFPIFYSYLSSVLLVSLLRVSCHRFYPGLYQNFYWYTEFPSVLFGYGVIFEIYKTALKNHSGVARFAQNGLLAVLLSALTIVAVDTFSGPGHSLAYAIAKLGRDLRYVELALWILMLVVFGLYRIPAGQNLKGLSLGYGLFIVLSVVNLTFVFQPGNPLAPLARKLPSVAYLITLMMWCTSLWSLHAEALAPAESQIERDYETLAARTRTTFARAMNSLVKSILP